jgi:hypothetical protein
MKRRLATKTGRPFAALLAKLLAADKTRHMCADLASCQELPYCIVDVYLKGILLCDGRRHRESSAGSAAHREKEHPDREPNCRTDCGNASRSARKGVPRGRGNFPRNCRGERARRPDDGAIYPLHKGGTSGGGKTDGEQWLAHGKRLESGDMGTSGRPGAHIGISDCRGWTLHSARGAERRHANRHLDQLIKIAERTRTDARQLMNKLHKPHEFIASQVIRP